MPTYHGALQRESTGDQKLKIRTKDCVWHLALGNWLFSLPHRKHLSPWGSQADRATTSLPGSPSRRVSQRACHACLGNSPEAPVRELGADGFKVLDMGRQVHATKVNRFDLPDCRERSIQNTSRLFIFLLCEPCTKSTTSNYCRTAFGQIIGTPPTQPVLQAPLMQQGTSF